MSTINQLKSPQYIGLFVFGWYLCWQHQRIMCMLWMNCTSVEYFQLAEKVDGKVNNKKQQQQFTKSINLTIQMKFASIVFLFTIFSILVVVVSFFKCIGGQACQPAAELALDDVNNKSDLLPGFKLTLYSNDSEVSAISVSLFRFLHLAYRKIILSFYASNDINTARNECTSKTTSRNSQFWLRIILWAIEIDGSLKLKRINHFSIDSLPFFSVEIPSFYYLKS